MVSKTTDNWSTGGLFKRFGGDSSNSSTGISDDEFRYMALPEEYQRTNPRPLSNWDSHLYAEIYKALDSMSELPSDDPMHLDYAVAERTVGVLGFLKEQMKVDPPSIINQGGEAIALTWVEHGLKKYLTVADDEIDLMLLSTKDLYRCEEVLSEADEIPFKTIFDKFAKSGKSTSVETE